jgi:threonine/homoserine/homoserine lactone efflux protein
MRLAFALKGLALGFSIAAPVGPIGVLCIRRSITDGRAAGLATGLGAATADAMYGAVAAFGLTAVSGTLVAERGGLGLFGGLFLCYLGVRMWTRREGDTAAGAPAAGLLSAYASTFVLTLTNPMTILSFVAIFAGLGLASGSDRAAAAMLVGGVFLGSALWWVLLSAGAASLGSRVNAGSMRTVNRCAGAIIFAFGLYALSTAW